MSRRPRAPCRPPRFHQLRIDELRPDPLGLEQLRLDGGGDGLAIHRPGCEAVAPPAGRLRLREARLEQVPTRHTARVGNAEPRPEIFSRVADTSRFDVLHEAADELLDELTDRYAVERRDTKEMLGCEPDASLVRVVRLIPRCPAAGPLAVTFTDRPALVVSLGRWYEDRLPGCGCEDCDEDPAELIADLRAHVNALVEGGLWERVRRRLSGSWQETRLVGSGCDRAGTAPLGPAEARSARREGFAAAVQWAPWPRRGPD